MTRLYLALVGLSCVAVSLAIGAAFQSFDHAIDNLTDRTRIRAAAAGDDEFAPVHVGETARV